VAAAQVKETAEVPVGRFVCLAPLLVHQSMSWTSRSRRGSMRADMRLLVAGELTYNPVFQELRSRFWHTGGMYPNCDTFAERLKDGRTTDYRRGKGNLVLVYGDRDG
jgi:hypothetical protein